MICNIYYFFRNTPFANGADDSMEQILARIGEGKFAMTGGNWDVVSSGAKDLVCRMLYVDPHQRITLQQILTHRWIMSRDQLPQQRLTLPDTSQSVKVCIPTISLILLVDLLLHLSNLTCIIHFSYFDLWHSLITNLFVSHFCMVYLQGHW